jgi:hypothetical protein
MLSIMEAKYMAILEAFQSLLPMMDVLEEAREKGILIQMGPPWWSGARTLRITCWEPSSWQDYQR